MGFTNSVLGGAGTLIRKFIRSPNYVAQTSGWSINKVGDAEFNNATIRGAFTIISPDGSEIFSYPSPGGSSLYIGGPPVVNGVNMSAGSVHSTGIAAGPGAAIGQTFINGEGANGHTGAVIILNGNSDGTTQIDLTANHINANTPGLTTSVDLVAGWQNYTPTIIGDGGTATYSGVAGRYIVLGPNCVHFEATFRVVNAGSGTALLQTTTPTNIDKTFPQTFGPFFFNGAFPSIGLAQIVVAGSNNNIVDRIKMQNNGAADIITDFKGANLTAGSTITFSGTYQSAP